MLLPPIFRNPAAVIAVVAFTLLVLGLTMVYSASGARAGLENRRASVAAQGAAVSAGAEDAEIRSHHGGDYFRKQLFWAVAGLIVMIAAATIPMEWLERLAPWLLAASVVVLILLLVTPLGIEAKGARRWMRIGPFTLQPSEFAKVALVIYMARFLSDKRMEMRSFWKGIVPAFGVLGMFSALVLLEKDLGMTALSAVVILCMWCLARMSAAYLGGVVLLGLCLGTGLIFQHSYRLNRILAFLDPEKYAMSHAYQLNQSLIAVGSGGIFGRGLGFGMQKYHFLSEAHTDFIFAVVCEELGFVGAVSIVILFSIFIHAGFRIARKAPDYFGGLMAAGLTMLVGWAVFINLFVVLGLAPTKGLALPFFSYGGSSLIATMAAVGLLINIGNYTFAARQTNRTEALA